MQAHIFWLYFFLFSFDNKCRRSSFIFSVEAFGPSLIASSFLFLDGSLHFQRQMTNNTQKITYKVSVFDPLPLIVWHRWEANYDISRAELFGPYWSCPLNVSSLFLKSLCRSVAWGQLAIWPSLNLSSLFIVSLSLLPPHSLCSSASWARRLATWKSAKESVGREGGIPTKESFGLIFFFSRPFIIFYFNSDCTLHFNKLLWGHGSVWLSG